MSEFKLGLFENAIDSLNEALVKYEEGQNGEYNAYKFCVQHLSHFLELSLKYHVIQSHPLLIYKNPFAKVINDESQTIGLYEAINFLKNEGCEISTTFERDIDWLKKIRNSIEHHKFSMNTKEVEQTIGRLINAIVEFYEKHINIDLSEHIYATQYDLYHDLADTYGLQLKKAEAEIERAISNLSSTENGLQIFCCPRCDHDMMIPNYESDTGYKCAFCGNEESEDIAVKCGTCASTLPLWKMELLDRTNNGNVQYYCPNCLDTGTNEREIDD